MGTKDEDFDGLTESERAVLAELDDDEDDLGTLREIASDDDEDDGDDEQAEAKKARGAGKQADDEGDADDDEPDDDDESEAADKEERPAAAVPAKSATPDPIYKAEAPGDAAAQLRDLAAERKAIRKQYEDGELDEDAYEAKLDELDQKRDAINRSVMKAEISAEMTQQQLVKSYRSTVDGWLAEVKTGGFDYAAPANAEAAAYLNARVKALAKAEPNSPQTPEGWRSILEEAHMLTARKFGIKAAEAAAPKAGDKPAKAAPKKGDRAPDLTGMPPVIGRGPAAAAPVGASGEFDHLESLSGIALERAIAKLTPEQLDRYLG